MRSFGRCLTWPAVKAGPGLVCAGVALLLSLAAGSSSAQSSSHAAELYQQARARETALRKELDVVTASSRNGVDIVRRMRTLAGTYEDLWRLFPTSGYSDNALWQGAMLSADAFWQSGEPEDRARALRMFQALTTNFPTSSLLKQVPPQVRRLDAAKAVEPAPNSTTSAAPAAALTAPTQYATPAAPTTTPTTTTPRPAAARSTSYAQLTAIRRDVLPDVLRVTLELEREPVFNYERIDGPPRVFIDMQNTRASEALKDASLPFGEDVVRQIRVGRQLNGRTRVVLDLLGAGKYSVYALYDPFRIVIDFERKASAPTGRQAGTGAEPGATWPAPKSVPSGPPDPPASIPAAVLATTTPSKPAPRSPVITPPPVESAAPVAPVPPVPPSTNSTGSFSLSRQLGLGVARIVIDAGHGGHDPGAKVNGLTEADLTLDIALRLEKLLAKQPGVEVILTRRTDAYVQLEERTAIANRAEADLFLSIHANASDVAAARGIETYFLNFAPNQEAEAVAARENAASSKTMRNLPDIVKAIALNNKIDESRDFASIVQAAMFEKLRRANKDVRNLGVKQAPFMVLIGATMPSILAEISFITNRQEGSLLKTEKYRQQIAEALYQGVMQYQRSLKKVPALALDTRR